MRKRVRQGMPGYDAISQGIDSTAATSMGASARAAGSQVGAQAGANLALNKRRRDIRQLGIAAQQYRDRAEFQSGQATKSRAPYEMAQYEYNEWLPWQIAKNEIAGIRGTGQQQLMTGLDQGAAAGIHTANLFAQNQYYGGGGGQPQYQQTPMAPYNYGQAGAQINQMGQQQVQPAVNLGNPY